MNLASVLPEVPDYLLPIGKDELRVSEEETVYREDVIEGDLRTRTMAYSG